MHWFFFLLVEIKHITKKSVESSLCVRGRGWLEKKHVTLGVRKKKSKNCWMVRKETRNTRGEKKKSKNCWMVGKDKSGEGEAEGVSH